MMAEGKRLLHTIFLSPASLTRPAPEVPVDGLSFPQWLCVEEWS